MKNNKSIYILLPLVIIIWAVIGYRLVKYLSQDKVAPAVAKIEQLQFQPDNFVQDTFTLVANYRDPFLGELKEVQKPVPVTPKTIPKVPFKANVKWPTIVFKGLIKNRNSNRSYALISINGKLKSILEKEEIAGIKILNVQRDSVFVSFENEKRSFHKK